MRINFSIGDLFDNIPANVRFYGGITGGVVAAAGIAYGAVKYVQKRNRNKAAEAALVHVGIDQSKIAEAIAAAQEASKGQPAEVREAAMTAAVNAEVKRQVGDAAVAAEALQVPTVVYQTTAPATVTPVPASV